MADNMQIWNKVFQTDPKQTKAFTRGGGFKGTAIKPYWLIMRATEIFGPVGTGWGWDELENKVVAGIWCSKVRLWYHHPMEGLNKAAYIEQWGQTVMEGENKNGHFVDEEAPKKAVTDAVTKCLSYLGFGGDVHMGLFDDSKYTDGLKAHATAIAGKESFAEVKEALLISEDPAETWGDFISVINQFKKENRQFYDDLVETAKHRKAELLKKDAEIAAYGQSFVETR